MYFLGIYTTFWICIFMTYQMWVLSNLALSLLSFWNLQNTNVTSLLLQSHKFLSILSFLQSIFIPFFKLSNFYYSLVQFVHLPILLLRLFLEIFIRYPSQSMNLGPKDPPLSWLWGFCDLKSVRSQENSLQHFQQWCRAFSNQEQIYVSPILLPCIQACFVQIKPIITPWISSWIHWPQHHWWNTASLNETEKQDEEYQETQLHQN